MAVPLPFPAPNPKNILSLTDQIAFHTAKLEEGIYIGDYYAASTRTLLTEIGITHILTVAANTAPLFPNELKYHVINIFDEDAQRIIDSFDDALDWIEIAVAQREPAGRVLVHCHAGRSRSATICCAYLMRKHRWSAQQAIEYVKDHRDSVEPNDGFVLQLKCFEAMQYRVERSSIPYRKLCIDLFADFASSSTPASVLATPHPLNTNGNEDDAHSLMLQNLILQNRQENTAQVPQMQLGMPPPQRKPTVPTLNLPPRRKRSTTLDATALPGAVPQKQKPALRCRKCRRYICSADEIKSSHNTNESPNNAFTSQNIPIAVGNVANDKCNSYFFDPPPLWLEQAIKAATGNMKEEEEPTSMGQISPHEQNRQGNVTEGKIACPNPKCDAKLGQWRWSGVQCSCGQWVTPGFAINACKVDLDMV